MKIDFRVITVNIIDFVFDEVEDFHTSYHLREDRHRDSMLTEVCELHFLNIVKFRRSRVCDLENPLNRRLIYFDENSPEALVEEVMKMDSAIQMVQGKPDMIGRDPEMYRAYEKYEKAASDYTSGMNGAMQKGRQERERDIARNLKTMGVPLEQIIRGTGLTEAQIKEL